MGSGRKSKQRHSVQKQHAASDVAQRLADAEATRQPGSDGDTSQASQTSTAGPSPQRAASAAPARPVSTASVVAAARRVLGLAGDGASQGAGASQQAARTAAVAPPPMCFFGLHPLGLGNCIAAGEQNAGPVNFETIAAVSVLRCGHLACEACVVEALAHGKREALDGGSRAALTAACPQCDAGETAVTVPTTPDAAATLTPELRAAIAGGVRAHVPRLLDASSGERTADRAAVTQFASVLAGALMESGATTGADGADVAADTSVRAECGNCEEAPEEQHCVECGFGLCADCLRNTHSKGKFKKHTIVALSQAPRPSQGAAAAGSGKCNACPEHPEYPLELYCSQCERCLCLRCNLDGHEGHSKRPLAELHGVVAEELRGLAGYLSRGSHVLAEVRAELRTAADAVETSNADAKTRISEAFAAARRALDEKEAAANAELEAWRAARSSALTRDLADCGATEATFASAAVGIEAALTDDSTPGVAQLLGVRDQLVKRAGELSRATPYAQRTLQTLRAGESATAGKPMPERLDFPRSAHAALERHGPNALQILGLPLSDPCEKTQGALLGIIEAALRTLGGRFVDTAAPPSSGLIAALEAPIVTPQRPAAGQPPSAEGKRVQVVSPPPANAAAPPAPKPVAPPRKSAIRTLDLLDFGSDAGPTFASERPAAPAAHQPQQQDSRPQQRQRSRSPPDEDVFNFTTQEPAAAGDESGAAGVPNKLQVFTSQWASTTTAPKRTSAGGAPPSKVSRAEAAVSDEPADPAANLRPGRAHFGPNAAKARASRAKGAAAFNLKV